jgi:hypothetical protein
MISSSPAHSSPVSPFRAGRSFHLFCPSSHEEGFHNNSLQITEWGEENKYGKDCIFWKEALYF